MNPVHLTVDVVDFFQRGDDVVLRLHCDDATAYEVPMLASQAIAIGYNIAERSEEIVFRRSRGRAWADSLGL